jgi:hypothetical protein
MYDSSATYSQLTFSFMKCAAFFGVGGVYFAVNYVMRKDGLKRLNKYFAK